MLKKSKLWSTFIHQPESAVILGTIILLIILAIATKGSWYTVATFKSIFKTTALIGTIAIGQALLLIGGEFDLSVGSVYAFSGIAYVWLGKTLPASGGLGPWHAFIIIIATGAVIGLFNSFLVSKIKISSLIVTLGTMFIFRGIANGIGKGWGLPYPKSETGTVIYYLFGGGYPLGLHISLIWLILITLIFAIILSLTRYGNHLQAVGKDPLTALSQGISPDKVKLIAFVICSALASFAAVLGSTDEGYAYASSGNAFALESIAAAVLGGCIIGGGIGSIWGTVLGVFLLATVRTGLIMVGAPPYWYITFVGIVLILIMAIKSLGRKESLV